MNYSTVELFKNIPFDVDYRNTIDFDTEVLQEQFFNSSEFSEDKKVIPDALYIDYTKGVFRVEGSQGQLYDYNYMRYKNADRDKWYYAFILSKRYLSDGSTELTFSIDVMQTFMFNYNIAPGFIERGHVDRYKKNSNGVIDFTIHDNNINGLSVRSLENIDSNAYVYNSIQPIYKTSKLMWIYITFDKEYTDDVVVNPHNLPKLETCCIPYDIQMRDIQVSVNGVTTACYAYSLYSITGNPTISEHIVSMTISTFAPFLYNYTTIGSGTSETILISGVSAHRLNFVAADSNYSNKYVLVPQQIQTGYEIADGMRFTLKELLSYGSEEIVPITDVNTNKEINNEYKLKMAPFSFFSIGTKGDLIDYRLNDIAQKIQYSVMVKSLYGYSNNYSIILDAFDIVPVPNRILSFDYNNASFLPSSSTALAKYIEEKQDTVLLTAILQGVTGALISGVTMNPVPAIAGMGAAAGTYYTNKINAQNAPDNVKLVCDGFNTLLFKDGSPSIAHKTFNKSFLYQCFDNLYRYGYTVNLICDDIRSFYKKRYWFNFIKTKDIEFDGSTVDTQVFEQQIKGIYNAGITFWHYNNGNYKFCEYDKENVERAIM